MKTKVLALGLMAEQLHGIKYASEKDLYIIGIDRNLSLEVKPYINEYYNIDLRNVEEIIDLIKDKNIQFIIPSTIGNLLTTVGAINDRLGLPGVTLEYAKVLTNKDKYSQHLIKSGLFTPQKLIVTTEEEVLNAIKNLGLPCILKPAKGSGSRGVIVIHKSEEILSAIQYALDSLLEDEKLIVEKYIDGPEYGVDFEVNNDEINILSVRKKILTNLPYRQEVGYVSVLDEALNEKIKINLMKFFKFKYSGLKSLGHIDLISYLDQLYFIEMALRPAGLGIMYNFLPYVIGYNPVEYLIDKLLGDHCNRTIIYSTNVYGLFFWNVYPGKVISIDANKLENLVDYKIDFKVGNILNLVKNGNDIFSRGYFILKSKTENEILEKRLEVLDAITVEKFLI